MKLSTLLKDIFSPAHRRAAKERRKEYASQFEQHRLENEKRVRRLSQLRGDVDTGHFLYDSAHGTGAWAASASRRSLNETRGGRREWEDPIQPLPSGRPFEMLDGPRGYGSTSTYGSEGTVSSNSTGNSGTSVLPDYAEGSGSRNRPVSLPVMSRPRMEQRETGEVEWWAGRGEVDADADTTGMEHVQVLGGEENRELRMSAMVA